jgi:hypothetical protein
MASNFPHLFSSIKLGLIKCLLEKLEAKKSRKEGGWGGKERTGVRQEEAG